MDKSNYRITFAQQLINLLQNNLPSGVFKQWYEGDPVVIPETNYPAVCIVKTRTVYTQQATQLDGRRHFFNIILAFDKRTEFGLNSDQVILQNTMEQLTEGIDGTTNLYSTQSVVGILRTLFSIQGWSVDQNIQTNYSLNTNRGSVLSMEAVVSADFLEMIQVPNRQ